MTIAQDNLESVPSWNSSRDALLLCFPPDWRFAQVNLAAITLLGIGEKHEASHLSLTEISPLMQPDGSDSVTRIHLLLNQAMRTGAAFSSWRLQRSGAPDLPCELALTRVTWKGQTGVLLNLREIGPPERGEDLHLDFLARTRELHQIIRLDGRLAYVNDAWCKTLGYSRQEAVGLNLFEVIDPDFHTHCKDIMANVQARGWSERFEVPFIAKEGHRVLLEGETLAVEDTDGQIRLHGVFRDVTEIRMAERRFRMLFECLPEPAWICTDTHFIEANSAALATIGSNRSRFLKLHPADVSPEYQPDGELSRTKAERMAQHCLEYGVYRFDWMHQRLDGTVFPVAVTGTAIDWLGKRSIYITWRDLTEEKLAQSKLEASEERFRALFDTSPFGAALISENGQIELINAQLAKDSGHSSEELVGQCVEILVPDRFQDAHPRHRKAYMAAQTPRLMGHAGQTLSDLPVKRKDGSEYPGEFRLTPFVQGDSKKTLVTIEDITRRKQTDKALKENESRFRQFVEDTPVAMAMLDRDMNYVAASRAWISDFGIEAESLIGLPHDALTPDIPGAWREEYRRALGGETISSPESVRFGKDGTREWSARMTRPWRDAGGEIRGIITTAIPTTLQREQQLALQESQRKFQRLVDDIGEDYVVFVHHLPPGNEMIYVSSGIEAIFGLRVEDVIGKDWASLVDWHPDTIEIAIRQLTKLVKQEAETVEHEMWFTHPNGELRTILVTEHAVFETPGEPPLIEGIARNITRDKQFAGELIDARQRSEAANLAKSQFLSNMSHEIRTPLNIIIHSCYLLDKTALDEQQANRVRTIETAGEALLAQINKILDLAKIEAGEVPSHLETFSLAKVWKDLESMFMSEAATRGLTLSMPEVLSFEPVRLHGDLGKFRQVLTNLIGNALKFTERGSVRVEASMRRVDETLSWLTVRVHDTGIGISDADLPRLFKPFVQLDISDTRTYGGTGLGLHIARTLTEQVGGQMGVESLVGQGSCFWITWPFEPPSDEPDPLAPPMTSVGLATALSSTYLLVVDDNQISRDVCRNILEYAGATVMTAGSGKEALECIAAYPLRFDAVLMDIQMPGMDGRETCRHLREGLAPPDLPIIGLSAGVLESEQISALASGMNAFISKPVKPELLLEILNQLIVSRRGEPLVMPQRPNQIEGPCNDWPAITGIDATLSREISADNRVLFGQLLTSFMTRSPALIRDLRSCVTTDVRAARHQLLGMAGHIGASELVQCLNAVMKEDEDSLQLNIAAIDEVIQVHQALMSALDKTRPVWKFSQSASNSCEASGFGTELSDDLLALKEDLSTQHANAIARVDRLTDRLARTPLEQDWRPIAEAMSLLNFSSAHAQLVRFIERLESAN